MQNAIAHLCDIAWGRRPNKPGNAGNLICPGCREQKHAFDPGQRRIEAVLIEVVGLNNLGFRKLLAEFLDLVRARTDEAQLRVRRVNRIQRAIGPAMWPLAPNAAMLRGGRFGEARVCLHV